MPDNLNPMRCSQDRFGASSISLTRSVKYVGWLLGSSIGPVNLYCDNGQPVPVTLKDSSPVMESIPYPATGSAAGTAGTSP